MYLTLYRCTYQVFYLGEDDQWEDGDSISYGEKGEVRYLAITPTMISYGEKGEVRYLATTPTMISYGEKGEVRYLATTPTMISYGEKGEVTGSVAEA
jgi:hypothetical protein